MDKEMALAFTIAYLVGVVMAMVLVIVGVRDTFKKITPKERKHENRN